MTGREGEEPAARPEQVAPKDIAATLRLRPERSRVIRLSRRVLVGLGGVATLVLGGALIWALQTRGPRGWGEELYNTDSKTTADGLAGLPKDYSSLPRTVPQLGPPLPGDLGKPMLNAGVAPPAMPGFTTGPDPEQQRLEQERQRLAQEMEAARVSKLFASDARATIQTETPTATPSATGFDPAALAATAGQSQAQQSEGDRKLGFLNAAVDRRTVSADRVQTPPSRNVVQAGAVIAAALLTGLRSDLPGQITAQVTEAVYDSPTGKILLIPQGARLIGQYDAQITFGQSRALLVWNRIIFPNGKSIVLERQPGADAEGYAGVEDEVDNHWGQLFKAALLSTILSVGSEAGTSSNKNSLVQAFGRGASDSISQTGRQVVGRSLSIQPTIAIRPGFPVRVIVTRDLVLEPYRG